MNNLRNKKSQRARERRLLPFIVEFVKFSTGFAVIIAVALLTLHVASVAMG
ncbi:MAG TPA: hypothetical protein VNF51_02445 [Candidatus Paceibacterota bacterium]|nr:hypothetical protein [Candidatus Paceibacterota bacterium]